MSLQHGISFVFHVDLLFLFLQIMALSTDDVRHVMIEYYPSSYRAYVAMLHEKEKQAAVSKTSKNGKTLSIRQTNALKKAMKDSSDYNALLLQQRREERASYYDMQTQLIHIPARRNKKLPPNMTIPSKYPVALLPGQYQEYYHSYSFRVLNQLPLNTVIAFPPPPQLEVIFTYCFEFLISYQVGGTSG